MILVIDNYDSFTYNLVHYIGEFDYEVLVKRNDEVTLKDIRNMNPEKIVISPGPCTPKEAGISVELIKDSQVPLLGVCLGHQSIAQALGGKVIRCHEIIHGKTDNIFNDQKTIFKGIPDKFNATRYHSLVVSNENLPSNIEISAKTSDGIIMGIRHKESRVEGIQFHPESIATDYGHKILKNFVGL